MYSAFAKRYFSLTNLAFSSSMIDSSAFFLVSDVIFPTSEVKQSTRVTCISLFSSLEDDALTEKDDDCLVEFLVRKTVTRDGRKDLGEEEKGVFAVALVAFFFLEEEEEEERESNGDESARILRCIAFRFCRAFCFRARSLFGSSARCVFLKDRLLCLGYV